MADLEKSAAAMEKAPAAPAEGAAEADPGPAPAEQVKKIGRASCRERVSSPV